MASGTCCSRGPRRTWRPRTGSEPWTSSTPPTCIPSEPCWRATPHARRAWRTSPPSSSPRRTARTARPTARRKIKSPRAPPVRAAANRLLRKNPKRSHNRRRIQTVAAVVTAAKGRLGGGWVRVWRWLVVIVCKTKQTDPKNKEKESAAEKVEILSDVIMDVRVLLVSLLWAVSCVVSNSWEWRWITLSFAAAAKHSRLFN